MVVLDGKMFFFGEANVHKLIRFFLVILPLGKVIIWKSLMSFFH